MYGDTRRFMGSDFTATPSQIHPDDRNLCGQATSTKSIDQRNPEQPTIAEKKQSRKSFKPISPRKSKALTILNSVYNQTHVGPFHGHKEEELK